MVQQAEREYRRSCCLTRQAQGRDVRFRGLIVPGASRLSAENMIAVWQTTRGQRFQNYPGYVYGAGRPAGIEGMDYPNSQRRAAGQRMSRCVAILGKGRDVQTSLGATDCDCPYA